MNGTRPLIRGTLIREIAGYLRTLGLDPDRVFSLAGHAIPADLDRNSRVPVEAPIDLIERSATEAGQPDFGLRFARYRGMPDLGPLALLLRDQQCFGEALAAIAQSFHLHSNALYLSIITQGPTVTLAADLVTRGRGLSRQSAEMIVCAITEMLRRLLGPDWSPLGISFRHGRVLPMATYRRHLGVAPGFDREFNAVLLRSTDLARPLQKLQLRIDSAAEAMIAQAASRADVFAYRVQQLIVLTLPEGQAGAQRVAALLKIDRRTLHRRLKESNVTFSRLLCDVRLEVSLQTVQGSDRSFSDIAQSVGFEGLAVFSRWFRAQTGMTPTACRAQARAAA